MKPTYRIKDWDRFFETTESRKVINARWVPLPNKQDGKGYRRVAQHKNGIAIFCAWTLILQVASKVPTRGVLADHDGPLDAEDLAAKTGFPAKIFEQALTFLSDTRVGWITVDQPVPGIPSVAADHQAEPAVDAATTRAEGNGREQNGKEEKESRSKAALVLHVFDFWKSEMKHPKAQLTPDRKKKIEERLGDSTLEEIETAIRGCKASDFHMGREQGHPEVFDDIELICRKRSKLEFFIAKAPPPTKPPKVETVRDKLLREACEDCHGTGTKIIRGKGAIRCEHTNAVIKPSGDSVTGSSQDREVCVS